MDQQVINEFKTLFKDLRKHYLMNDFDLEDAFEENIKGDEVDQILEDRDRAMVVKLRGRQDLFLRKVDQAETRIKQGSFGECFECGDEIGLDRLRARPTATSCITCKEDQERKDEHVPYAKKSHTHGKTFQNQNVISFPNAQNDDLGKHEKILKFNRDRINLGLKH